MACMADLLIVDDEAPIRHLIIFSLQRQPYRVIEATDGNEALCRIQQSKPDLILLDWMLPDMSGVELIKSLRQDVLYNDIPIIMLTARAEEENKLRGFKAGADDYVTKPFSPKELAARIEAMLRRAQLKKRRVIEIGGLLLDKVKHEVVINGCMVHMGRREYQLLSFLMENTNRVFSRQQLLDNVWGRESEVTERTVDVHVLRVRKVLMQWGYKHLLVTVRGSGYRLDSAL